MPISALILVPYFSRPFQFITRFEPVIDPEPDREFEGHTEDVLDVTWSKGNLLLSASVDR